MICSEHKKCNHLACDHIEIHEYESDCDTTCVNGYSCISTIKEDRKQKLLKLKKIK